MKQAKRTALFTVLTYCGKWGQVQLAGEVHLQQQTMQLVYLFKNIYLTLPSKTSHIDTFH